MSVRLAVHRGEQLLRQRLTQRSTFPPEGPVQALLKEPILGRLNLFYATRGDFSVTTGYRSFIKVQADMRL